MRVILEWTRRFITAAPPPCVKAHSAGARFYSQSSRAQQRVLNRTPDLGGARAAPEIGGPRGATGRFKHSFDCRDDGVVRIAMAEKIEREILWRPTPGGPLAGTESKWVKGD